MSDIDSAPPGFWWSGNIDAGTLDGDVKNEDRILSLKTFVVGGERRYAAIWIADGKQGDWTGDVKASQLDSTLEKSKQLVSLDSFWRNGDLHCAAAWIDDGVKSWWRADEDVATIKGLVDPKVHRPICLRRHVSNGKSRYSAIWIKNADGRKWGWKFDATVDDINQAMKQNSRIVSIDTWDSNGTQRFAVIWVNNPGPAWFWNLGITGAKQDQEFDTYCCYAVDVVPWNSVGSEFACVMHAYPPPVDADETDQLRVRGSASVDSYDTADASRAAQLGTVELKFKNLTSSSLDISKVRVRALSSGGYMLWDGTPFDDGWPMDGQSSVLTSGATVDRATSNVWTPLGANALQVRILTHQAGQHQRNSVNIPIQQLSGSAGPLVANTPDPVFIGLWASPVEIIPLWLDGRKQHWVTISGHIVNSFPEIESKLTIVRVHLRLHDGGTSLIDEDLDTIYYPDPASTTGALLAKSLSSPVTTHSQSPQFIVGRSLPPSFASGTLEITLNYKLGDIGTGQCGGFMQSWPAKLLTPHVGRSPVTGLWNYGGGYNHTGWDGHASQFQRFSFDLTIEKNGESKKPSTSDHPHPVNDNNSFWCWDKPFHAIEDGTVVSWDDSFPDNNGRNTSTTAWTGPANYIVVESADGSGTAGYFHLKQGSIKPKFKGTPTNPFGAPVAAGEILAHVGNAGPTWEPHLHFGYLKKPDAHGRADMYPVEFNDVKDGSKNVDGTLSSGNYKS